MAGLVPAIHVFLSEMLWLPALIAVRLGKAWMLGTRPSMTR
jgi:hypothetical protein